MPADALRESLSLIARLADAAGTAHTRTAIARRLAEALLEVLPLRELVLARLDAGDSTADAVHGRVAPDGELVLTEERLPLAGTALARFAAEGAADTVRLLPGQGDGVEVLMRLGERDDDPREFASLVLGRGASSAFLEPTVLESVARVLGVALRNAGLIERVATLSRRAHRENQQLRQQLQQLERPERLVARSAAMRRVVDRAELVATHPTTVLLRGESGTGKELVARLIHRLSSRSAKAFLKVNCGAIPLELVESELFGHEKGSFTGASGRHVGLFERADGGTLLLDEVGELPLAAQVKLLRVLQEGAFERVGGEQTVRVDVRVLAATHRNLEAMVAAGQFRADLYYRLNVFPIVIPPLRERREDMHGLVEVLLGEIGRRLGRTKKLPRPTAQGLAWLRGQSWPGNVRELENVLERAVILSPGEVLQVSEAQGGSALVPALGAESAAPPAPSAAEPSQAVLTLDEAAREAIVRALRVSGGRIYGAGGAAELLGVKPSTLQSRMKKLGLSRQSGA